MHCLCIPFPLPSKNPVSIPESVADSVLTRMDGSGAKEEFQQQEDAHGMRRDTHRGEGWIDEYNNA